MASRPPSRRSAPHARRRARGVARLVAVAVAAVAALSGCDTGDGRDLADPPPGATAPPPPTSDPPATTGTAPATEGYRMELPGLVPGAAIPARHACDGEDLSPAIDLDDVPAGTVELALVVRDVSTDPAFFHWVVTGIDPAIAGLLEGAVPAGAVEATNSFGTVGWQGPCPPDGETHDYRFDLYALPAPSGVAPGAPASEVAAAVEAAATDVHTLTFTYGRPA